MIIITKNKTNKSISKKKKEQTKERFRDKKNFKLTMILIVLFGIGTLLGFTMAGSYSDLYIWATWCLINVVLAVIDLVKKLKVQE